jgi:C4-dicarboxylate-specific signal transduction histidine kinase
MKASETRVLTIHTSTSATSTTIIVRDTGPGISFNPCQKLKEPFYQSSSQGLGMGLIISQMIIERHQGHMQFSNHEVAGLSVSVEIPRQRAPS